MAIEQGDQGPERNGVPVSTEDSTRRLIVSAERLADTSMAIRKWAAGYLPGQIPQPLQAIIDAAEDYTNTLDEYNSTPKPKEGGSP